MIGGAGIADYAPVTSGLAADIRAITDGIGANGVAVLIPIYTYHVDSRVAETGDGTLASPFKDLTDLPALSEGDSVGLAYGSTWTEQDIDTDALNVTIGAYGNPVDGLPVIDANGELYCINLSTAGAEPVGHRVSNVSCTGATDNNGCIVVQGYGTIDNVEALEGGLHNLFLGWGRIQNSLIRDGGNGVVGSFSLVVLFTTEDGKSATVSGCTIESTAYDSDAAGLISHTSGGAAYDQITTTGNTISNMASGIALADLGQHVSEDDVFDDILLPYTANADTTIINPTVDGQDDAGSNCKFMSIDAADLTVSVSGGRACIPTTSTAILCNATGLNLTLEGGFKLGISDGSFFSLMQLAHGEATFGDVQFYIPTNQYVAILGRGSEFTLNTPGPVLFNSATNWSLELNDGGTGGTYSGLAGCQAEPPTGPGKFLNADTGTVGACI